MFKVVVERRKRSIWSARTVAISAGAHLLVLAGVVTAAANARTAPGDEPVVDEWVVPEKPSQPAPVKPATPPPPAPDQPVPVKGQTLQLEAPEKVPDRVLPPHPGDLAVSPDDFSGEGRIGDVIGPPDPGPPQPPTGPAPLRDFRDDVIEAGEADQLPELLSPREAQRMLERVYPNMLRDAGVTGHTTVLLVIDRDGKVEPGSVTVQETTHDAFREAAVRAAERFRFRPAKLHGQPVAVSIAIPIDWQIQN